MAQNVKTVQGLAIASVKTVQGLAIASAKTIMGVDNTGGGGGISIIANTADALGVNAGNSSDINSTGANLLVVFAGDYDSNPATTIADNKSNSWTAFSASYTTGGGAGRLHGWYSVPTTVGTGHHVTLTGATSYSSVSFIAVSGANATPKDQETGTASVQTHLATGSITPSVNNTLVFTACCFDATLGFTVSGYSDLNSVAYGAGDHFGLMVKYQTQTTATATNPDWTTSPSTSATLCVMVVNFKP